MVDVTMPGVDFSKGGMLKAPMNRQMNLSKQLKLYLEHRGMTAAQLARKSGVSKQVLSLWIGGGKPRDIEQVKRVADALSTTIDHLMFGHGPDAQQEKLTELDALMGEGWVSGLFEVRLRRVKR